MLNLKIKFNLRFFLVFLITLFWFLLIFSRYFIPAPDIKNAFITRLNLVDKFLVINFLDSSKIASFTEFKENILQEAADIYQQAELYSKNNNLKLKLAILYAEQGKENLSQIEFRKVLSSKPSKLNQLVYNLYYHPNQIKNFKQATEILRFNLSGYFLAQTLQRAYSLEGINFSSTSEHQKIRKSARVLVAELLIFSLSLIFLFSAGIFLVILFFFKRKTTYGVALPVWSITQGWLVFIFWDWLQLLFGVVLGILKIKISSVAVFAAVYIFLSLVILILILKVIGAKDLRQLQVIGFKFDNLSKKIWLGLGAWCSAFPIVGGIAFLNRFIYEGTVVSSNPIFSLLREPLSITDKIILFLIVCILAPLIEETVFRGFLYTTLRKIFSPCLAIFLVAFIFAFIHADIVGLLPLFGLSCILTFIYEYSGSIVPSFIVHSLWNTGTFLVFMVLLS